MAATVAVLPAPSARDLDAVILPHNIETERSTLGAAMVRETAADYVVDHLTADAFHRRAHQTIFLAMRELRRRSVEIDYITLRTELERVKKLDEVGGPSYLTALTDGIPRSANVEHYAAILKELQTKRALVRYAERTLNLIAGGEHSAAALVSDADTRLLELQKGHAEGRMMSLKESAEDFDRDFEWRVAHAGELSGLDTGFPSINELTMGWQPGDLIIVAARPSIGKTTFVMNSAVATARTLRADGVTPRRVAVFSFEMRRLQLEYRMVSSLANVPLSRILSGRQMEADCKPVGAAMNAIRELDIHIDDLAGQNVWDIRATCRRLKAEGGLDEVIIDYVQLMPGSLDRRGATRNEEVTDISRRLKVMADELGVPIILLSQLSRAAKDRADPRPKLSDLRESGALEQDADLVCFLHRKNHREGGVTHFIIEKQRNGPTGTVNITLDRDTVTFTDGGDEPPAPVKAEAEEPKRRRKSAPSYGGRRQSDPD
jgi:replicative DNA helicase